MVVPTASHGSTLVHLCFHWNWNAWRIESKAVYPNIFLALLHFIRQSQPVQVHCWNSPRIPRCLSQNLSGKAKTMDSAMASPWGRRKMSKKGDLQHEESLQLFNSFVTSWNYGRFPVQIFSPNESKNPQLNFVGSVTTWEQSELCTWVMDTEHWAAGRRLQWDFKSSLSPLRKWQVPSFQKSSAK